MHARTESPHLIVYTRTWLCTYYHFFPCYFLFGLLRVTQIISSIRCYIYIQCIYVSWWRFILIIQNLPMLIAMVVHFYVHEKIRVALSECVASRKQQRIPSNSIAGKLASGAHVRVRDKRGGSHHNDERTLICFWCPPKGGFRTNCGSLLLFWSIRHLIYLMDGCECLVGSSVVLSENYRGKVQNGFWEIILRRVSDEPVSGTRFGFVFHHTVFNFACCFKRFEKVSVERNFGQRSNIILLPDASDTFKWKRCLKKIHSRRIRLSSSEKHKFVDVESICFLRMVSNCCRIDGCEYVSLKHTCNSAFIYIVFI